METVRWSGQICGYSSNLLLFVKFAVVYQIWGDLFEQKHPLLRASSHALWK